MDAYGGFLISKYGGTCLVEVEDHFVRSFAILIHHKHPLTKQIVELAKYRSIVMVINGMYCNSNSITIEQILVNNAR